MVSKKPKSVETILIPIKNYDEELVIAMCNEDVSWVDEYAKNYVLVTIYNKCGKRVKLTSKNIKLIESPNIGGCDHAFLSYIIDRYNDLPTFIEFTKGSLQPKKKYHKCLQCKNDNISYKKIMNFKINNHIYANKVNRAEIKNQKWYPSGYKNMEEWIKNNDFLNQDMYKKNVCNIIYGGQFGTTSEQIYKTPKKVWETLRSQQKYPREEVDHFIERTWRPLLCRPKYKLVIVAIFKNESHILSEWIQHYMRQGVDHFYMIDNGSTDNWQVEIENYPVTIYTDEETHKQTQHYNDYFLEEVKRNSEWVIVVDLDEFMYSRNGNNKITDFLDTLPNDIGEVSVLWKMFGSNGHIKQPKSVIDGFTKRKNITENYDKSFNYYKSICRTNNLKKFEVHHHKHTGKSIKFPEKNNEKYLEESPLHLNHYAIQSLDFFTNVKMNRGDVISAKSNNVRNIEYFNKYDTNEIVDMELLAIYKSLLPVYSIHNKDGDIILNTNHEVTEQNILRDTLKDKDRVLQLGANIGASCITANKVAKLTDNYCVEPQSSLIPILKRNINNNNVNSTIVEGIISENCDNKVKCNSLDSITPDKGFTYLFADCEGCFPDFIQEYGDKLSNQPIHTIVYEEHRKGDIDYTPVNAFLEKNKYTCTGDFHKTCKK